MTLHPYANHAERTRTRSLRLAAIVFLAAIGSLFATSATAGAQEPTLDPVGLTELPVLTSDTLVLGGYSVPHGLETGCGEVVYHHTFVATQTQTPIYIDYVDDMSFGVLSSANPDPAAGDLTCFAMDFLSRPEFPITLEFGDPDNSTDGYLAQLETEIGHTYWLGFGFGDDGSTTAVAINPGNDIFDRANAFVDQLRTVEWVKPPSGGRNVLPDAAVVVFEGEAQEPVVWCSSNDVGSEARSLVRVDNTGFSPIGATVVLGDTVVGQSDIPADDTKIFDVAIAEDNVELSIRINGRVYESYEVSASDCVQSQGIEMLTSCVAAPSNNMRVDVMIVNDTDEDVIYFGEFSIETALGTTATVRKSSLVRANGQGRISITGRPTYRDVSVEVFRSTELVAAFTAYDECDALGALGTGDEVVVTTSCLAGNGFVRYAIGNNEIESGEWFIDFEGLDRRSTSSGPRAAAYGGISGRADGTYEMSIFRDGQTIWSDTLTIACD